MEHMSSQDKRIRANDHLVQTEKLYYNKNRKQTEESFAYAS